MNELTEPRGDRDRSTWYAEFAVVPSSCCYLVRMLENTKRNLDGLAIHAETMKRTLHEAGSLIVSEAVMIALAEHVGRQKAHSIVHEDAMRAVAEGRDFRDCLLDDERVTEHFSEDEITSLTDPAAYTGCSASLVDSVFESLDGGEPPS